MADIMEDDFEEKMQAHFLMGSELRVGDVIEVYWCPSGEVVWQLVPYNGPLAHVFPKGAQIATFMPSGSTMTIGNGYSYLCHRRMADAS